MKIKPLGASSSLIMTFSTVFLAFKGWERIADNFEWNCKNISDGQPEVR